MTTLSWRDAGADAAPQRRFFRPGDTVRLHANEHPWPPVPSVLQAMAEWAIDANRYPFGNEGSLVEALAAHLQIPGGQVLLGAGSNELLYKVIAALGGPGAETVFPHPSYPTFSAAPSMSSARAVPVPLSGNGACDTGALLAAVTEHTTCVVACSPNNPTGGAVGEGDLLALANALAEHVLLIVDEAYFEYTEEFERGGRGALELFPSGHPVLVTRSFSKYFGLAGVRLGYGAVSSAELAAEMRDHLGPSAVSGIALRAGEAALRAEPEYRERLFAHKQERNAMWQQLRELGLHPYPTETNFIFCDEPGPATAEWLADKGLSVRSGKSVGSEGHLRVTVGTPEHNALLLGLMAEHIEERAAAGREGHREAGK